MKLALAAAAALAAFACLPRLTKFRSILGNCARVSVDQGNVSCGGRLLATIECYRPRQETCGSLAVLYPDGERVFLYEPPPGADEWAERPQVAEDAVYIWFKRSEAHQGNWESFEMDSGILNQADVRAVLDQQGRHGARPLWTLPEAKKPVTDPQ